MSSRQLIRATLAHRRWLVGYEEATARQAVAAYDQRLQPLLERLERYRQQLAAGRPLTARQRLQAERDRARLARLTRAARDDIRDTLQTRLEEAAVREARISTRNLSAALPRGHTASPPPLDDLRTLLLRPVQGSPWTRRLDADLVGTYEQINAGLAAAIRQGAGTERAARLLEAATGGIEGGRHRLRRIARTEIQRVANETAQRTYRANRDVVRAVRYLATLDSRVCPVCRPDHRRVFPLDEAGDHEGPAIPRHPHCRCFYAPVVRSLREIIGRAD